LSKEKKRAKRCEKHSYQDEKEKRGIALASEAAFLYKSRGKKKGECRPRIGASDGKRVNDSSVTSGEGKIAEPADVCEI